jgi:hypothetical protein
MALIRSSGGIDLSEDKIMQMIRGAGSPYAGESEHTKLLLKHGYAVLADKPAGVATSSLSAEKSAAPVVSPTTKPDPTKVPKRFSDIREAAARLRGQTIDRAKASGTQIED